MPKLQKRTTDFEPSPTSLLDAIGGAKVIRNVRVHGWRTSVRLEQIFWDRLQQMADLEQQTLADMVTAIRRGPVCGRLGGRR